MTPCVKSPSVQSTAESVLLSRIPPIVIIGIQHLRRPFWTNMVINRVTFHACAHGGTRDKSTTIWQSAAWFDRMALLCDGKPAHDSWRPVVKDGKMTFPTAQEASYPYLMCERIVACVASMVKSQGAVCIDSFQVQNEMQQSTQQRRIAMGALARGSKIKPLVAEF